MRRSPCYNCPDRAVGGVGCHDRCDRYQAYRAEMERVYTARRETAQIGFYVSEQNAKRDRQKRTRRWRMQP